MSKKSLSVKKTQSFSDRQTTASETSANAASPTISVSSSGIWKVSLFFTILVTVILLVKGFFSANYGESVAFFIEPYRENKLFDNAMVCGINEKNRPVTPEWAFDGKAFFSGPLLRSIVIGVPPGNMLPQALTVRVGQSSFFLQRYQDHRYVIAPTDWVKDQENADVFEIKPPLSSSLMSRGPVINAPSIGAALFRILGIWPLVTFAYCFFFFQSVRHYYYKTLTNDARETAESSGDGWHRLLLFGMTFLGSGIGLLLLNGFVLLLCLRGVIDVNLQSLLQQGQMLAINSGGFRPEPIERLMFLTTVLASPFVIAACHYVCQTLLRNQTKRQEFRFGITLFTVPVAVYLFLHLYFNTSPFSSPVYVNLLPNTLFLGGLYCLILFPLVILVSWLDEKHLLRRSTVWVGWGIVSLAFCYVFFISLYRSDCPPKMYHFNPVYYSISQVLTGKTCLVDLSAQYGNYAHFFEPILRLTGGGVFQTTLLFAVLNVLSYLGIAGFLWCVVKNNVIRLLGFLFLFAYQFCSNHAFLVTLTGQSELGVDPYYQYTPIRIFPAVLALFLTTLYYRNRNKYLYVFLSIFASLTPFWNIETGIVVCVTWGASLIYNELQRYNATANKAKTDCFHRIVYHGIVNAVVFAGTMTVLYCGLCLRGGARPGLQMAFSSQSIFYRLGFMMESMPLCGFWYFIAFLYLLGLCVAVTALWQKLFAKNTEKPIFSDEFGLATLIVTFLGVGLFIYYQGRSHEFVLKPCTWPAVILLTMFTDRLYSQAKLEAKEQLYGLTFFAFLWSVFLLASPLILMPPFFPAFYHSFSERVAKLTAKEAPKTDDGKPNSIPADIEFIRRHTKPGDRIFVFYFDHESLFYGETKTRSALDTPSSTEWFNLSDLDTVLRFLRENRETPIFVSKKTNFFGNDYSELEQQLFGVYYDVKAVSSGDMVLYVPKK